MVVGVVVGVVVVGVLEFGVGGFVVERGVVCVVGGIGLGGVEVVEVVVVLCFWVCFGVWGLGMCGNGFG